ncbi:16S rRNA (cytosine(1402)-N(4))-methyltransferase RsmH [Saccharibacillus sp. JS10]|uniref:16S rRNA (cytosine(1402)-N(4))-methyltransferase RsmH n=1 Tax=Saccharibacillus sp. JS10 TaxID=2950552 RepID=UPI00210F060D|nr:16S rRNA (cytosine(1402)-N(4))-methyltransferase RsmH [Saccharibacillus sp. JS10]MCQ4086111.1 16S rRNA (cytosine(1402)-N(4))-methyltransferase RsmH [Saccharibacillus sp. JS10]
MFHHITVLKEEAVAGLNMKPDGIYVDCTLGGAGHSALIASKLEAGGRLIALDQDDWALDNAREKLAAYSDNVTLVKTNFRELEQALKQAGVPLNEDDVPQVDGFLFDLGVSSPQFDEASRGFSYNLEAPLDMRMDQSSELTAKIIVNEWSEEDIARILYRYGEEKFSRRIAGKIGQYRAKQQIETTTELAEIIKDGIPAAARRTGGHPAKRSFQALRIAVNDELSAFEDALHSSVKCLAKDGRISVITFHSLEDRICKQILLGYTGKNVAPPGFPVEVYEGPNSIKLVNRKPILPTDEEIEQNKRARSAKLRIAEKIK